MTSAFTIGYGGRKPAEFVELLTRHGVRTLVDVRLRPDRASMGTYSLAKDGTKGIAGLLAAAGVAYLSLPELGNLFLGYDDSLERYSKFLALAGPLLFDRLNGVDAPLCLMCAEKRVADCHRKDLAKYLEKTRHWSFDHIV